MNARFDLIETPLAGLIALRRRPCGDSRGFLERIYCADELAPALESRRIAQINRTLTQLPGTVRGLHFQYPPHAETKVVTCLRGSVFDVAVDLRRGSPSFLAWYGRVLSADNRESLIIPEGFAHGFQTLEHDCELLYLHTAPYTPQCEGGLDALDATFNIRWPREVTQRSERDTALPGCAAFGGIAP